MLSSLAYEVDARDIDNDDDYEYDYDNVDDYDYDYDYDNDLFKLLYAGADSWLARQIRGIMIMMIIMNMIMKRG